ncbi:MAG: hypothetical protein E7340_04175 [Clostridiales bacterium]|nr:hypothetical protein [Clostridiales bacterium]
MFCVECGKYVANKLDKCPYCECTQLQETNEGLPDPASLKTHDGHSAGLCMLSFAVPILGFILYSMWRKQFPMRATAILRSTITGAIALVALLGLALFLFISGSMEFGQAALMCMVFFYIIFILAIA